MITAVNRDQAIETIAQLGNIDIYSKQAIFDSDIRTFIDNIVSVPSLQIDVDLSQTDIASTEVAAFMATSLSTADTIIESTTDMLLSRTVQ